MLHSESYDKYLLSRLLRQIDEADPVPNHPSYRQSLARQFRKDYSDFAVRGLGDNKDYLAEFPDLKVYILRGNMVIDFHGPSECVVLEDQATAAHVVLKGERIKQSLLYQGGMCGFLTEGQNPVEEIRHIFKLWDTAISPIKEEHPEWRDQMDATKKLFKEIPFQRAAEKFLAPIFGPETVGRFNLPAPSARSATLP